MAVNKGEIEIYQSPDKQTEIRVRFKDATVWLTQSQLVALFNSSKANISEHIKHIFESGELDEDVTVRKFRTVQIEGSRSVERNRSHYNLDVIISVGYRVNTFYGIKFRQWATHRLKDYLVQGYAVNEKRLAQKEMEVHQLKTGIQIISRAIEQKADEPGFDWLRHFAKGLELLDDYDHEQLDTQGATEKNASFPSRKDYQELIDQMKADFSSAVFGVEKDRGFDSAINQIAQAFDDEDVYPTLEEKAAMLLYLIVKNHAFTDGNKRIAAACFLLFLEQNQLLSNNAGDPIISNEALASLTLFVAASKPEEMETVKRLVISVLNRNK